MFEVIGGLFAVCERRRQLVSDLDEEGVRLTQGILACVGGVVAVFEAKCLKVQRSSCYFQYYFQ